MKPTNDTNASIVTAIWEAARLRDGCKADPTLGGCATAISDAWDQVFVALVESPRPNPEEPGSSEDWARHQPLIQQMADAVNACMVAVRKGKNDAVTAMQAKLVELRAQLSAGANPVPPAIRFASNDLLREAMEFGDPAVIAQVGDILERHQRADFSARTRQEVHAAGQAAARQQADYEAGKAAAQARNNR
ncbi:MAG: hypothetical protein KF760_17890 [Candidatus Eremiobacteraeota bacterium]|nr:hypothetical protein [Candidatus Eremiobacteraeota bacterium]MCW5869253.1 hypothetical protein [Candidatus Eremiobacteraeota bacterium]